MTHYEKNGSKTQKLGSEICHLVKKVQQVLANMT